MKSSSLSTSLATQYKINKKKKRRRLNALLPIGGTIKGAVTDSFFALHAPFLSVFSFLSSFSLHSVGASQTLFEVAEKNTNFSTILRRSQSAEIHWELKMPSENSNAYGREGEPFVEVDPTGRFGRYDDLLGYGAVKKVYRAFDQEEGIEVAWNQVKLRNFSEDPVLINRLHSEVDLLRTLSNKYIIVCFCVWKDEERHHINFITEVCTSGNLRDYRKKHRHVSIKALKKWSKQVLEGLEYLHTHDPCIIHRDLNCSNIFVNGNIGQVKIGDLGLAAIVGRSHAAHSILGTPEYMAPELYEEDYTEMVDIYSFGMCLLEMVTMEIPYSECDSVAKIYKKVTMGIRPQSLNKVTDPEVKAFIEKCIAQPRARPSATELLKDPFFFELNNEEEEESTTY